jgi:hypothetical protein
MPTTGTGFTSAWQAASSGRASGTGTWRGGKREAGLWGQTAHLQLWECREEDGPRPGGALRALHADWERPQRPRCRGLTSSFSGSTRYCCLPGRDGPATGTRSGCRPGHSAAPHNPSPHDHTTSTRQRVRLGSLDVALSSGLVLAERLGAIAGMGSHPRTRRRNTLSPGTLARCQVRPVHGHDAGAHRHTRGRVGAVRHHTSHTWGAVSGSVKHSAMLWGLPWVRPKKGQGAVRRRRV